MRCFVFSSVRLQYLLSSGFLSIIKKKCGACKGCVKPPVVGPASPVLGPATATADASLSADAVSAGPLVKKSPCTDAKCPFVDDAVCLPDCECNAQFVLNDQLVTRECTCPEIPDCLPPTCKVTKPVSFRASDDDMILIQMWEEKISQILHLCDVCRPNPAHQRLVPRNHLCN